MSENKNEWPKNKNEMMKNLANFNRSQKIAFFQEEIRILEAEELDEISKENNGCVNAICAELKKRGQVFRAIKFLREKEGCSFAMAKEIIENL